MGSIVGKGNPIIGLVGWIVSPSGRRVVLVNEIVVLMLKVKRLTGAK